MTTGHPLMRQSTTEQPEYGTERITLLSPLRRGGKHTLIRQVFSDEGHTTFYDEESKDWVQWRGSWVKVEGLGQFDNQDQARDFLIARSKKAA